jgi:hypothetical protein
MFNRSEKYTITGMLTLLMVSTIVGIGGRQEGVPAQTTEAIGFAQEAPTMDRVFYRNGETKTMVPEIAPAVTDWPSSTATELQDVQTEFPPVIPEPIVETVEPDPLMEAELQIQSTQTHEAAPTLDVTDASGTSMTLLLSAAVIGIIVLGGILFSMMRLLRRYRPTLSKEAMAPPPIAADEPSLPRLETALGMQEGQEK